MEKIKNISTPIEAADVANAVGYAQSAFRDNYGITLKAKAVEKIRNFVATYGAVETVRAVEIACSQYYDAVEAMQKLGGILYNRQRIKNDFFENGEEE